MQWEYQFVVLDLGPQGWQPRYINGRELPNWTSSPPAHVFSNQLGAQGWELITFAPVTVTTSNFQFFSDTQKVSTQLTIQLVFKHFLGNSM